MTVKKEPTPKCAPVMSVVPVVPIMSVMRFVLGLGHCLLITNRSHETHLLEMDKEGIVLKTIINYCIGTLVIRFSFI